MTIAERIRLTRQRKILSQAELADASGVNKKSLSRYEFGASVPPADALSVSADYLLSDEAISIKDKDLFEKFEDFQEIEGEARIVINNFLDITIRG